MNDSSGDGLIDQLRALIRDGAEYLSRLLELQQARFTAFALTSVIFVLQIIVAFFLGAVAFILFNVAIGLALAHWFGSGLLAVVSLATLYTIFSILLSYKLLRWLNRLKS